MTASTWFKAKGHNNALTIPATKGEALLNQVRKEMGLTMAPNGYSTLVMEDGGLSIKMDMVKSNIHQEEDCKRPNCLVCAPKLPGSKPTGGSCRRSGACYNLVCTRDPCRDTHRRPTTNHNNKVPIPTYAGESSRTCYTRGLQHLALYQAKGRDQQQKSWMLRHTLDTHGGVRGPQNGLLDYQMELQGTFTKPLERLLMEGAWASWLKTTRMTPGLRA